MEFKEYQTRVMEKLDVYLQRLSAKHTEEEEYAEFQRSKGRAVPLSRFPEAAWEELSAERLLPWHTDSAGRTHVPPYVTRRDGLERSIPHACLKVPTGGGKTLLATAAVERVQHQFLKRQTGLVLWVVPTDSIYKQTWKALANRVHPYRQMLERACGGRVKMLEKGDAFTRLDVETHLCVLVVMLQASNRETKEQLRMFRDAGRYESFFPLPDAPLENVELLKAVPNLDTNDLTDTEWAGSISIKHSLGNVLRVVRPVVVVDEGHKAYSALARQTLAGFNPAFVLELSATPNTKEWASNIVVNVPGAELKEAQMIKLPIELENFANSDWKMTLAHAVERRAQLEKTALSAQNETNRYVRPILLVRVERTGKEQREAGYVHSEDVREYLLAQHGMRPEEIRVKSAELDELDKMDLLAETCEVRVIITKAALQEGWDCPFAYVLAVLSDPPVRATTRTASPAATALTQMVGRVLRQPGAQLFPEKFGALNRCSVFTYNPTVQELVDGIKAGLEEEGMGDLRDVVSVGGGTSGAGAKQDKRKQTRGAAFKELRVLVPRVLAKDSKGHLRHLVYERDVLAYLPWQSLRYRRADDFRLDEELRARHTRATLDIRDGGTGDFLQLRDTVTLEDGGDVLDLGFLARQLLDVVPNPFIATDIIVATLDKLRARGVEEEKIAANRVWLVQDMREDLKAQVQALGEAHFRAGLTAGSIKFELVDAQPELNWEVATELEIWCAPEDRDLQCQAGGPLKRSLFEPIYQKQLNGLEKEAAWYLDATEAVRWWHKMAVHGGWHLQGWQRNRVYPDFLVCVKKEGKKKARLLVLETKGLHLKGNDDTDYKRRLFELLNDHMQGHRGLKAGELMLEAGMETLHFEMLMENTWQQELVEVLA